MNEEFELLKDVALRLQKAGINYMITGSMAMAVYSTPRMTRDIDIIIEISYRDVERIVALFRDDFYIDEASVRQAVCDRGMFNIIHSNSVIKVDFIIRKNEDYRIEEFSRRQMVNIEGLQISIVATEDLVLSKLVMSDTSVDIEKRMSEMITRRTPVERLKMASSMFDLGKKLMVAGLQQEHGSLNEAQIRARIFLRLYGDCYSQAEIERIVKRIPNMQLD